MCARAFIEQLWSMDRCCRDGCVTLLLLCVLSWLTGLDWLCSAASATLLTPLTTVSAGTLAELGVIWLAKQWSFFFLCNLILNLILNPNPACTGCSRVLQICAVNRSRWTTEDRVKVAGWVGWYVWWVGQWVSKQLSKMTEVQEKMRVVDMEGMRSRLKVERGSYKYFC